MDKTKCFFFYDLETSGLSSREDRIMQFAGIRTDLELNPISEPVNILLKLPDDTLPAPEAVAVTKITPQMTQENGLSEAEFCRYVQEEIFIPGTCILGFNSVRFDDEFMRHLFWRNFYDPYEWQWKEGRSRWDILDLVRMTRALRPEGINWPTQEREVDGEIVEVKTNRLELITKLNKIEHEHAHDALADVYATVAVAKLIKEKQPELFNFLFKMRSKRLVQRMVNLESPAPFVYTCGRYENRYEKTTVAFPFAPGRNGNVLVYDLRYEPGSEEAKFKELCYNRCPAVAPLGVLEKDDGWAKIGLDKATIEKNLKELLKRPEAVEKMCTEHAERPEFPPAVDPESALYDGFVDGKDRNLCKIVRAADKNALADFHPDFRDERLEPLLLHYKARNFSESLSEGEQQEWEKYRLERLKRQVDSFGKQIEEISKRPGVDPFIVEELLLWYQSVVGMGY